MLTEGRLLVHSLQTSSSVTLQSVAGVVSAHPAAGDTVLAATEAGDLYTLDIAADTASLVTVLGQLPAVGAFKTIRKRSQYAPRRIQKRPRWYTRV